MYFFSEENYRGNHAGTKARNDVEKILRCFGCKPINSTTFVLRTNENEDQIYSNVKHRYQLWSLFHEIQKIKNELVVVQYPMLAFDHERDFFSEIAKNNDLILIIHDLHSLKRKDAKEYQDEISLLNFSSAVIVHNAAMKDSLLENGLSTKYIFLLDIFDYLYDENRFIDHYSDQGIAFAGNLEKSVFLKKMVDENPDLPVHLYGQQTDIFQNNANVIYHGSFSPDVIPGVLQGKFGLVWDGDSTEKCSGIFGEYLKYNNPHKTSLYVAADMPVAVWERAAIARYIEQKQIGITISSISELNDKIQTISPAQYKLMQKNIHQEKLELIKGNRLKSQLHALENILGR